MTRVAIEQAREDVDGIFDSVRSGPVLVSRDGQEIGAVVSMEDYEYVKRRQIAKLMKMCRENGRIARANGLTEEILEEILNSDD